MGRIGATHPIEDFPFKELDCKEWKKHPGAMPSRSEDIIFQDRK